MKLKKFCEYDLFVLIIIVWLMNVIYPTIDFKFDAPTELMFYVVIPGAVALSFVFALDKVIHVSTRIGVPITISVLVFLSIFLSAFLVPWLDLGKTIHLSNSVVQPLAGACTFIALLSSMKKPRLRWPCFIGLIVYLTWKNPSETFSAFRPIGFFWGSFIRFVFPSVLYLQLAGSTSTERKVVAGLRHVKKAFVFRMLRVLHLGVYVSLIFSMMYLTLNLQILKTFYPSLYLLKSIELVSPFGWVLVSLLTISVVGIIPLAILAAIQKVRSGKHVATGGEKVV